MCVYEEVSVCTCKSVLQSEVCSFKLMRQFPDLIDRLKMGLFRGWLNLTL